MWRAAARRPGATAPSASITWSCASLLTPLERGLLGACHGAALWVFHSDNRTCKKKELGLHRFEALSLIYIIPSSWLVRSQNCLRLLKMKATNQQRL